MVAGPGIEPGPRGYEPRHRPLIVTRKNYLLPISHTKTAHRHLCFRGLEPKGGYDPPSERYECSVLPIELLRQILEPIPGLEPGSRGYRPRTSPPTLDRQPGAGAENRTPLTKLATSRSTNGPRPHTYNRRA